MWTLPYWLLIINGLTGCANHIHFQAYTLENHQNEKSNEKEAISDDIFRNVLEKIKTKHETGKEARRVKKLFDFVFNAFVADTSMPSMASMFSFRVFDLAFFANICIDVCVFTFFLNIYCVAEQN